MWKRQFCSFLRLRKFPDNSAMDVGLCPVLFRHLLRSKVYIWVTKSSFFLFFLSFFPSIHPSIYLSMYPGEGQREWERERESQAGSALSAQSPTRGSISWTMRSWPEPKPRVGRLTDGARLWLVVWDRAWHDSCRICSEMMLMLLVTDHILYNMGPGYTSMAWRGDSTEGC